MEMQTTPDQTFRHPLNVQDDDIDDMGHVNNVVYLRWFQEVADMHWKSLTDDTQRKTMQWVVLRHEIDYRHQAFREDCPYALTWVGDTQGLRSIRHIQLFNQSGILLSEGKTTWCLVDPVTRKPRRISPEVRKILGLKD